MAWAQSSSFSGGMGTVLILQRWHGHSPHPSAVDRCQVAACPLSAERSSGEYTHTHTHTHACPTAEVSTCSPAPPSDHHHCARKEHTHRHTHWTLKSAH